MLALSQQLLKEIRCGTSNVLNVLTLLGLCMTSQNLVMSTYYCISMCRVMDAFPHTLCSLIPNVGQYVERKISN